MYDVDLSRSVSINNVVLWTQRKDFFNMNNQYYGQTSLVTSNFKKNISVTGQDFKSERENTVIDWSIDFTYI